MFNLRGFDMNLLVVFEAVYQTASVSRAADRLALSQAATSHALARLRLVCKDELFVRSGQRFVPTQVAESLFPRIEQALALLRMGLGEASGFDPAQSERHFTIAIPHPLGPLIALKLRAHSATEAPLVDLHFDTRTMPPDMTEPLRDGGIDLAIDWLAVQQDQFINQRLLSETLMLVARTGHPRIREAPTLEAVQAEEFVWLHPRGPEARRPKVARQIDDLGLKFALKVSEALEIPAVVAASDVLSFLPVSVMGALAPNIGLTMLPFPMKLTPLPIFAVWHESRRNDAGHRWLREMVAAEFTRQTRAG
jgi:DNA-binding transcriptional LysR family regulator